MSDRATILVQALSGRGKTFRSVLGGRPLVLATEAKCRAIIPIINPNATIYPITDKDTLEKAIIAVKSPTLVDKYDRIVLDSYSELTELIPEWYGMGHPLQIQDYGTIGSKAMALVIAITKAKIPGVIIARSESKEQGKHHKVVPGGLGKSASNLPAKCVLTAESRYDDELGWVLDTTPDEYTQRSGLPWVPMVFAGDIDSFLRVIEVPVAPDTVACETPTHPREEVQQNTPDLWCSNEECLEIIELSRKAAIPEAQLKNFLHSKGWLPDPKNMTRIKLEALGQVVSNITDKSSSFRSHLASKHAQQGA